jgi:CubicO group peptidase (beta-lactamase class C family)
MKKYLFTIFIAVLIFNQKIARVEIPIWEQSLLNYIHTVIGLKKAVRIDSFFTARYQNNIFNGTVLFAEKGRILYENSFGYSDLKAKSPLQLNSVFQLASVSKPLTACAILMLYEKGLLDLEDSLQKYFPDFPYQGITIRLLLTHRSGLPDYMYFAHYLWKDKSIPLTNQDVLDLMLFYKPARYYLPNRRYNYSNTNFCLLALLIEKVSGMSYARFMQQYIFQPLGMRDSYVLDYQDLKDKVPDNLAAGYHRTWRKAENSYLNGVVGDKGIYSTVEDLFRWDQALYYGELVSLSTLEKAFKPAHRDLRDNDNYGFGWRINLNDGNRIIYHSGWWNGYKTYFIRKVEEKKTIIVLTNTAMHGFMSVRKLSELL